MNVLKRTRQVLAMLCIAAIFCSGCKKDKQKVYALLPPDPEEVSAQATVTTNIENPGGASANEGSSRINDGDANSKFLNFSYDSTFYIQYQFHKPEHITNYVLISANDSPSRDPKDWNLAGSNDGTTWVTLDTRKDESFAGRGQVNSYDFTNPDSYTFYRLNITANGGDDLFQMAEWQVTNFPIN